MVRFAETDGFEHDADRPDAWRYRDYVIRSFNEDKPVRPLRPRAARRRRAASRTTPRLLVATGFLRAGPSSTIVAATWTRLSRQESSTTSTDAASATAFLGLTVGCARCHDHKFDPIPQADYYRLQAFFARRAAHD